MKHHKVAMAVVGISITDDDQPDEPDIYGLVKKKYGIDPGCFDDLIDMLLPLIDYGKNARNGKMQKGFAEDSRMWLSYVDITGVKDD